MPDSVLNSQTRFETTSDWSVARLSPHVSVLLRCCDLGLQGAFRAQAGSLLTQLSVYADFTSHPPAVLAALLSNPPFLPFPHPALLLLGKSLSPITIPTYITSLSLLSCPAPAVQYILLPVYLFPPPSHPSSINSVFSPSLFVKPSRLDPWLFWQPTV